MHKSNFHEEKLNTNKKKYTHNISPAPYSIIFLNYFHCLYINMYIFCPTKLSSYAF